MGISQLRDRNPSSRDSVGLPVEEETKDIGGTRGVCLRPQMQRSVS